MSLRVRRWQTRVPVAALALTFFAGAFATTPAVATHGAEDCPEVMPVSEVRDGMRGTGWTVAEGREREEFDVEVLGVLEDAFPGRDLIMVETSGEVIDEVGGIWYGMSGSPVYVDDKLVGAVAFGLSYGPSRIGALTPAEEMFRVLDYPTDSSDGSSRSTSSAGSMPQRVPLSEEARARITQETGASDVGGSFEQLKVPLSVSGVGGRGMKKLNRVVEREELPVVPYLGNSASGDSAAQLDASLHPGDNLIAALSYGDITFAGLGTATFVCEGTAMGFGHPFFWEGETTMGANAATSIAVLDDPFFTFEIASVAEGLGSIDQDRFAGIRSQLGALPATIPITSSVTALNNDRQRDGQSDAVISEIVPFLAFIHLYENILFTADQYSEGNSDVSWTIRGTTEDGSEWELNRSNMYLSRYDIAGESSYELAGQLFTLFRNRFEEIEFTSVDTTSTVSDEEKRYRLGRVLVSTDGGRYRDVERVRVQPGSTISLQATLKPYEEDAAKRTVTLDLQVPADARRDGVIRLGSGFERRGFICLYRPRRCAEEGGAKISSFEELVTALENVPKNNELLAELLMGNRGRVKSRASELLDQVIRGHKEISVRLPGGCCADSEPHEGSPSGR